MRISDFKNINVMMVTYLKDGQEKIINNKINLYDLLFNHFEEFSYNTVREEYEELMDSSEVSLDNYIKTIEEDRDINITWDSDVLVYGVSNDGQSYYINLSNETKESIIKSVNEILELTFSTINTSKGRKPEIKAKRITKKDRIKYTCEYINKHLNNENIVDAEIIDEYILKLNINQSNNYDTLGEPIFDFYSEDCEIENLKYVKGYTFDDMMDNVFIFDTCDHFNSTIYSINLKLY